MMFVGWKLASIVSNPGVFLQPAVESAALDIALVCDGKLDSKVLPPPPPGASWLVMNCAERATAEATSWAFTALQFYQAYKGVKNAGKVLEESTGKVEKVAGSFDDLVEEFRKLGKFIQEGELSLLSLDPNDVNRLLDVVKEARKSLDDAADLRKGIDDAFKVLPDDVATQSSKAKNSLDETRENLAELEKKLEDAASSGQGLELDCGTAGANLCESVVYSGEWLRGVKSDLLDLYDTAEKASGFAEDAGKLKKALGLGVADRKAFKQLKGLAETRDALLVSIQKLPKKTVINAYRKGTKRFRKRRIYPAIEAFLLSAPLFDLGLDYLANHGEFYDILEGPFIGIKYTPYLVNLVKTDSDEVKKIYTDSFNISGEFAVASAELKENLGRISRGKGYPETAGYIYNLETEGLIVFGYPTNIEPSVFGYATTEYVSKCHCEGDRCENYLSTLLEVSVNMSLGELTLDELRDAVLSDSVCDEQQTFLELLDGFEEEDRAVEEINDASFKVQQLVASWMKDNCGTDVIHYPEGYDVEVANCGMVIDCTPGEFCYVGLPVVDAEPWIPYVPVSYLEGQDASLIANLVGFNYDSASRVITPGFFGCSGIDEAYICATLPGMQRCKVVKCGKPVGVVFESFRADTVVEDRGDRVVIRGNLLKW